MTESTKMNANESYSSISRPKKREKLMDLIERKRNEERPVVKKRDDTNSKSCVKESMKVKKKLNAHFYKKLFQIGRQKVKLSNDANGMIIKENCSIPRRKKLRLCFAQGSGGNLHQSCTENKIKSGSGGLSDFQYEVSTEKHDHVLPYVNKLRAYWNRGQNAVFFDGQLGMLHDRIVKVVSFVSSVLAEIKALRLSERLREKAVEEYSPKSGSRSNSSETNAILGVYGVLTLILSTEIKKCVVSLSEVLSLFGI